MKTNERAKNGSQRCRWQKGKEERDGSFYLLSQHTIKNYSDCEWIFLPKKKYLTKENSQELQVLHKWDGSEENSDLQQGSNETYLTDQDRWGM